MRIISRRCYDLAKSILKPGDRVGVTKCLGTKRVMTFKEWDGYWMVSLTGINDYSPSSIYSINGKKFDIKEEVMK